MRKVGLEFKSWKNSSRDTFNAGFSPLARTAISNRLIALRATGSPRRTADSSALSCDRGSFLASNSHRMRTCVSNSKRGSRRQLLFRSGNFPKGSSIPVHDVAQDPALTCPTVAGRLPDGVLCGAEHRHGATPPGDGDGLPKLFNLDEAGEAFGLELRRTQHALLHDAHDNRRYGHLTNCDGAPPTGARVGLRDASDNLPRSSFIPASVVKSAAWRQHGQMDSFRVADHSETIALPACWGMARRPIVQIQVWANPRERRA